MWPAVNTGDVANLWRPLTSDEETVAATRIKLVEAELRSELRLHGFTGTPTAGTPGFETIAQVTEWATLYVGVVADVVRESIRNPEGWSEETERIDDYTTTRRRDRDSSSGVGFLDGVDIAKLLPRVRPRRGAFSIHLGQS